MKFDFIVFIILAICLVGIPIFYLVQFNEFQDSYKENDCLLIKAIDYCKSKGETFGEIYLRSNWFDVANFYCYINERTGSRDLAYFTQQELEECGAIR